MTAQVTDTVEFQGEEYTLCRYSGDILFAPEEYGLNPSSPSTACHLGWIANYEISDRLFLKDLFVFHDAGLPIKNRRPNGPRISGILPKEPDSLSFVRFNCFYEGLNIPISFTGGILITQDLSLLLPFGGWPLFWQYEIVYELSFLDGHLERIAEKSEIAQIIREKYLVKGLLGHPTLTRDAEVQRWLDSSFSHHYR